MKLFLILAIVGAVLLAAFTVEASPFEPLELQVAGEPSEGQGQLQPLAREKRRVHCTFYPDGRRECHTTKD
ncbi:Hypothetical protein NTJ_13248 [Nesidiocoris tenuis]|uniref:Uncharacterized protein n=1 Tax=Nesidiocoris tenuis TaxID=355587 RepID=A0ABN7B7S4_9HEMI|nr:Hypothetical protein NTJ_13248 [Nesidiocoris tenuis]